MTKHIVSTIPKPPKQKGTISLLCYWLAVGLGSGLTSKAPGTFGTFASLLFIPFFLQLPFVVTLSLIVCVSLVGISICGRAAVDMGVHDSGHIVLDEWAGQWIALLPLFYLEKTSFWLVLISFVLFRFFDILKPFPISFLDKKVDGGLGIMLDDLLAGLVSAVLLTLILSYL